MYGDSTLALPNLQALANDGILLMNAYSPVPVCAPARSAIITGMYPTAIGTHNMRTYNAYVPDNEPEIGIPSYSPIAPQGVKMFTEYLRKAGYYCVNNAKEDYNFKRTLAAWDESSTKAHWRNRPDQAPFFAVFNYGITHESQVWEKGGDALLVSPETVPVPPYFPDNDIIRHDLAVNYSNLIRMDGQVGEIIQQLKDDGLYEKSIIFFYSDHGGPFPRHKRALYETGIKVPMIIKLSNNDLGGTSDDRLFSFIDLAPTVLSLAGIDPPRVMQGRSQLGKYAAQKKPDYIFSSSDRFDAVSDRLRAVRSRNYKYIRNYHPEKSNALPVSYREQMPMMQNLRELDSAAALDSLQSLWFRIPKPEEELYDLEADPYELSNLAGNPELQDTLVHLRQVLAEWIKETGDLGQYQEKELLANWFPDGQQPLIPPLELEVKEEGILLFSSLPDATIIWKQPQDSIWKMYTAPLQPGTVFEAKAERLGYKDSEILKYE